ncbi:uncharacterized protein DEA37_0007457, partial [Paragonimus westermani]
MEGLVRKLENYMQSGTRRPVYPWTFSSKIRFLPYVYYYKNKIFFKNYVYSLAIVTPITIYWYLKLKRSQRASHHHIDYFDPNKVPIT